MFNISSILPWLKDVRRDFHQNPELGDEEFRTAKKIRSYLSDFGFNPIPIINTGTYVDIEGEDSGITIAVRADIDALPIQDAKDTTYKSQIPNKMHACGHDAHTTINLGLAKYFSKHKPPCRVRLMFQPAEETTGGAERMIVEGVLEGVNAVLGLHVDPDYKVGDITVRYGVMNAASDMFKIVIRGQNAHGAYPDRGIDAIVIAGALIQNLQTLVSRSISAIDSAVLTLGKIQGGTAMNVIADEVIIEGTLRTLNPEIREPLNQKIKQIVKHTAEAFGGVGEYHRTVGYCSLINHDSVVDLIKENAIELLGEDHVHIKPEPHMWVEDFAYFVKAKYGAFFYLGVRNEEKNIISPIHSDTFDIDENALLIGVQMQIANISSLYKDLKFRS